MVRVLYCHGLESGPHGYKVEAMRAWAETVTCADQEMSLINPLKRHSIVRSLAAVLFDEGPSGWLPAAFQRSLEKCAQLQREALSSCGRVDVLVGSSWGGAVALKLLADGSYAGPSVLLCPAHRAPERWAGVFGADRLREEASALISSVANLHPEVKARCVLVHGTADTTIPIEDSRELAQRSELF
ncbi:hypothetical protein AB1Y20_011427 [Prymnesium parvum]|uniref:Serine hydrolase domain-containing protein n=1 Tax=Prymnesium parvum TaxID=97485 RepID=A0AB34ILU4_PRYPA